MKMSSAVRRIFTNLTRFSASPGRAGLQSLRSCPVRTLSITSHRCAKSKSPTGSDENDEELSKPIKFSTSKASHRSWRVERSMGSTHQRPWWRVLPFSIFCVGFLAWCFFRKESEIDETLEKQLYEHLPGLLSVMEVEEEEQQQTETPTSKKDS